MFAYYIYICINATNTTPTTAVNHRDSGVVTDPILGIVFWDSSNENIFSKQQQLHLTFGSHIFILLRRKRAIKEDAALDLLAGKQKSNKTSIP